MTIQRYPQSGGGSKEDKERTRHQHRTIEQAALRERSLPAKKDKRRWCRGKVGSEHQPMWEPEPYFTFGPIGKQIAWYRQVCSGCGKHLKHERRLVQELAGPVPSGEES